MWTIFLDVIGIIGGVGAVVVGLSAWLGKIWANRILQNEIYRHNIAIAELKAKLQQEIDRSKIQLDIFKESSVRYSEFQFKLYNELWGELYSLNVIADALWDKVDSTNMKRLVNQLKKTNEQVKKNALLIEEEHLLELFELLNQFSSYQVGKQSLIELRDNNYYITNEDIRVMIEKNRAFKDRYSKIIEELAVKLRWQLKRYKEN